MEATAEGRLYNHSPRLACLPGGRAERINLPPKDGCIIIAPGWLAYLGSVAEEESTAEERLYKSREIILAS